MSSLVPFFLSPEGLQASRVALLVPAEFRRAAVVDSQNPVERLQRAERARRSVYVLELLRRSG